MHTAEELARIPPAKRTANDPIIGTSLRMEDYWAWAHSNLLEMTTRSSFSEYLVASAVDATEKPREVWAPHDVVTKDGIRVEVKAAGYVQDYGQERLSNISFRIAPGRGWDATDNSLSSTSDRHSDVYVFAVLTHRHKPTVNPADTSQWTFYVLPTKSLATMPEQKTIQLSSLLRLSPIEATYKHLGQAIRNAHNSG